MRIRAAVAHEDAQKHEVVEECEHAALDWPPVDGLAVALGTDNKLRSAVSYCFNRCGDESPVEEIALEDRDMRALALQHAGLDRLAVASAPQRAHLYELRKALLQPAAGIERAVLRSVLDNDDFPEDRSERFRSAFDEASDKCFEIDGFVVCGNDNAQLHPVHLVTAAWPDSIESSMLV